MDPERLRDNLQRLLAELEGYAASEPRCQTRVTAPDAVAHRIAERMPLAHSLSSAAFARVAAAGRLLEAECRRFLDAHLERP